MKAIPTTYKDTTFRSRLEASYAAHFEARGLPWVYEPEAFTLSDGTNYLPDFWLPTAKAWAEIKGPHNERLEKLEQFSTDLWAESGAHDTYDTRAPMVLLFKQPRPPDRNFDHWTIWSGINIIAGHSRGSTVFTFCPKCQQTTIVALWQPWCRNCDAVHEDPLKTWSDGEWNNEGKFNSYHPFWATPFKHLGSNWKPIR